MKLRYVFIMLLAMQCAVYEIEDSECPVKEYYRHDGVEYSRCYR